MDFPRHRVTERRVVNLQITRQCRKTQVVSCSVVNAVRDDSFDAHRRRYAVVPYACRVNHLKRGAVCEPQSPIESARGAIERYECGLGTIQRVEQSWPDPRGPISPPVPQVGLPDLNQTTLHVEPQVTRQVEHQSEGPRARQAIVGSQGAAHAISPSNETRLCGAVDRTVGAGLDLDNGCARLVAGARRREYLYGPMLIVGQVTAGHSQPNSAGAVGRQFARGRQRRCRDFLQHLAIAQMQQSARLARQLEPDIMLGILGHADHHPEGLPIGASDGVEPGVLVDRHSGIRANPQAALVVFEHRSNLQPRQAFAPAHRGQHAIAQDTQSVTRADPQRPVAARQHGVHLLGGESFARGECQHVQIAEIVDPARGYDPDITLVIFEDAKHIVRRQAVAAAKMLHATLVDAIQPLTRCSYPNIVIAIDADCRDFERATVEARKYEGLQGIVHDPLQAATRS